MHLPCRPTRAEVIQDILQQQEALMDLSVRRDQVKRETEDLRKRNSELKDYIDNYAFTRKR